jgi:hypothetical protein
VSHISLLHFLPLMRHLVTIGISQHDLTVYTKADKSEKLSIVAELYDSMSEEEISLLLADFCTENRETFNNDAYCTDKYFDDDSNLTGLIEISFTGSVYIGCKDMDHLYERDESIEFTISPQELRIEFATNLPERIERYPDDEF